MKSNNQSAIITFGVPRSGTTLISNMFQQGSGYFYQKLAEGSRLHPIKSEIGLFDILVFLRENHVHLVRTIRHPVDVASSWVILDKDITIDKIIHSYRRESLSFWEQMPKLQAMDKRAGFSVSMISYEGMGKVEDRNKIFRAIGKTVPKKNKKVWNKYMEKVWNKHPVRAGRLSNALTDQRTIPDYWIERILDELGDVILRENLQNESQIV